MPKQTIVTHFDTLIHNIKDALAELSNGCKTLPETHAHLAAQASEFRTRLASVADPVQAAQARKQGAKVKRENQPFTFTWRSGHVETVVGWANAAKRISCSPGSLRVLLSRGKGVARFKRTNPETATLDIVEIAKAAHDTPEI